MSTIAPVAKVTKKNPLGAGRLPRAEKPADQRVTIRLTAEEYARFSAAAGAASMTLAEWLRAAAEATLTRKGRRP